MNTRYSNSILKPLFWLIVFVYVFSSCSEKNDTPGNDWNVLRDTSKLAEISASAIKLVAQFQDITDFNKYLIENIAVYKIQYITEYLGEEIEVSGLISIPLNTDSTSPVLVIENGLFYESNRTPSNFSLPDNYLGYEFIASYGYIVLLPDLIGFGDSRYLLHPLYHSYYSGSVVRDMIKAGEEFMEAKKIKTNNEYYFGGYSLGAYISMAAQKLIEEDPLFSVNLKANAIGGGGYNIYGMMKEMVEKEQYPSMIDMAFVFIAYNDVYQWNRPLSNFFKSDYDETIPSYLNGDFSREQINAKLPVEIDAMFRPEFIDHLRNESEADFIAAFKENSIHQWSPKAPLRIYHSRNDERIPFEEAAETYETMNQIPDANVRFIEIEGENHFYAVFDFMEMVIPWFDSIRIE